MGILDTVEGREPTVAAVPEPGSQVSIDRFEMIRRFTEREEEEKVEAAMALYEKAARARISSGVPDAVDSAESEEELEARSQALKLRQKCMDIAALIMVDEMEEELEEEEPRPRKRQWEE